MQRFLMTQSLLSSWLYLWSDFEKYGEGPVDYFQKSYNDFMAALRREKRPTSEAAQKGVDFENLVVSICGGAAPSDHKWYDAACEVAKDVKGGQFQVVASKVINVSGLEFLLYGKFDCLKAGVISDIKFTGKYEVGKFFESPQHPMYMELEPEAYRFVYIASNGNRVWRETYRREECRSIHDIIQEFIEFLQNSGLLSIYTKHWPARE